MSIGKSNRHENKKKTGNKWLQDGFKEAGERLKGRVLIKGRLMS